MIHPDYIRSEPAKGIYCDLLAYLRQTVLEKRLWIALPREIDCWWRQRSQMRLFHDGRQWRIEGPGSEQARVAYASLTEGKLTYHIEPGGVLPVFSESRPAMAYA